MDEVIENIEKVRDNLYRYNSVQTKVLEVNVADLNGEKVLLLKRISTIDYLLSEIGKLDVL